MAKPRDNLVLIGMPGSGKTVVGQHAAKRLGWAFVDVDQVIEREAGKKLWQINAEEGFAGLRRWEQIANLGLRCKQTVIAPGGSVVYSTPAMRHLKRLGRILYLNVEPKLLELRAGDLKLRGVMIRPGMTYAQLIAERDPLYRQWADAVIECGEDDPEAVAARIGLET